MSSEPRTFLTPGEYLEIERRAERKSEYFQGEMFAMAGASRKHIVIVTNLVREISQQLRGRPCEVYTNAMRLRVSPTGLYTYPDVIVVCGEPKFAGEPPQDTLLNPAVIMEVLSDSTQDYDRGRKFEHYRTLPPLMEYVTIAQDRPHVEHWTRRENHGTFGEYGDLGQSVELASIGVILPLAEIYHRIDFAVPLSVL